MPVTNEIFICAGFDILLVCGVDVDWLIGNEDIHDGRNGKKHERNWNETIKHRFFGKGNRRNWDHAIKRLRERKITREDVRNAIFCGEIIEDRPDDVPVPCCLILGANVKGRYLHVICGMIYGIVFIISAYYPDPERWEADLITRKG